MIGNWSLMVAVVVALSMPGSARAQDWEGLAVQPGVPGPNAGLEHGWNNIQKKLSSWRRLHVREVRIRRELAREHAKRPRKNNRLGR